MSTDASEADPELKALIAENPEAFAEAKRFLGVGIEFPYTLVLGTPVKFGKDEIESIVFQKGNFGVLKGLSPGRTPTYDEIMIIASRLSGRPVKVFELLDPDDVDEVTAVAMGFFGRCRGAGKKLSQF